MPTCIFKAMVHNFAVVSMPVSLLVLCVRCGFHSVYELVATIGSYTCPVLLGVIACMRKEVHLQAGHQVENSATNKSPVESTNKSLCKEFSYKQVTWNRVQLPTNTIQLQTLLCREFSYKQIIPYKGVTQ